ncbi:MAG: Fic family protein [Acidimicrobiaceae bacterium]|nr:Fic family protein [Acidimicrobiaceae bacterium]
MAVVSEDYSGSAVTVDWRGHRVRAWVPALLRERDLTLSTATIRAAERAVTSLRLADTRLPSEWEPMSRLLLRHEGVASSGIEGLREPIESVLVAQRTDAGGTAGWVADNLAVIDAALRTADEPLNPGMLHRWHERLMQHSQLPDHMVGQHRLTLGWVGGTSPIDAAYIPPPPSEIPELVNDLIVFADNNQDGLDAVSQAALTHAQFEAIHPYSDGNGRLGRVLICRILRRSGVTTRSTVPVSTAIARDPGGYLSGLHLFEQGSPDPWVRWFAETSERAAASTESLIKQATQLLERWKKTTSELRTDHTARALLTLLPQCPVLNAHDVSELLGVSERTGRTALASLVTYGILTPIAGLRTSKTGRTRHWFAATELLDLQPR